MFPAVLLLAFAAPAASPPAKPAPKGHSVTIALDAPVGGRAVVTGHLLNCRVEPSLDARIQTTIPRGTSVAIARQQGDWQLAKLKTRSCWVHTRYLSTGPAKD